MGLAGHVHLAAEPPNQWAAVEGSIDQGEGDEMVGSEDTSQEEHHMAYQENRRRVEILADRSAGFAEGDTSMDIEAAGIWEVAAGAD